MGSAGKHKVGTTIFVGLTVWDRQQTKIPAGKSTIIHTEAAQWSPAH